MKTLAVVLSVLAALVALLWNLRLGGRIEYSENGIAVQLRVGWLYITLFPRPKRKKKPAKKKKKTAKKEPEKPKEKKEEKSALQKLLERSRRLADQAGDYFFKGGDGGELGLILDALPEIFGLLGETVSGICVDEMTVHYTIAGRHDAAGAAIQYGMVYATGGVLCGVMEQHLTVKRRSIGAEVDFNAEQPKVYLLLNLSYRFGQLVSISVHVLKEAFKLWSGYRRLK